ncbi:hypothetical protein Taro_017170, partial [Colocasia esculenta]|nr:hypothetical protein [Colocasia esculenta]
LLPERLQQSKSTDEAHFEALTTALTMGFNKIEKLICSTSMAQDQAIVGTNAEKCFSTPPSITLAPTFGDANTSVMIVEQGFIAPDPVWDILWVNMADDEVIDIVLHVMKERQRK